MNGKKIIFYIILKVIICYLWYLVAINFLFAFSENDKDDFYINSQVFFISYSTFEPNNCKTSVYSNYSHWNLRTRSSFARAVARTDVYVLRMTNLFDSSYGQFMCTNSESEVFYGSIFTEHSAKLEETPPNLNGIIHLYCMGIQYIVLWSMEGRTSGDDAVKQYFDPSRRQTSRRTRDKI